MYEGSSRLFLQSQQICNNEKQSKIGQPKKKASQCPLVVDTCGTKASSFYWFRDVPSKAGFGFCVSFKRTAVGVVLRSSLTSSSAESGVKLTKPS